MLDGCRLDGRVAEGLTGWLIGWTVGFWLSGYVARMVGWLDGCLHEWAGWLAI